MNLYNISIIAAITGVVLLACYIIIKLVVKRELKKGLPNQIKSMQDFFGGKDVRVMLTIKNNGEVVWNNFEIVSKPDYIN